MILFSVVTRFELIILIFTAFLPPILYAIWIRNTERVHREKWSAIAFCFLWGATIAVIAAILLEIFLDVSVSVTLRQGSFIQIIAVIMIAPFAEELVKPLALNRRMVKRELREPEDGLIYGAVAGLGFSATENLLYGWSFLSEGLLIFFILMLLRSFGGCLLHASATALTGYGYGKTVLNHSSWISVLPYFLVAMVVHGLYNFLVTWEEIGVFAGLLIAFTMVLFLISYVRNKIRILDGS